MQSRLRHLENLVKDVMNAQVSIRNDSSSDGALVNIMQNDSVVDFKSDMGVQDLVSGQNLISNVEPQVAKTNVSTLGSSGQLIQSAKETTYVGATHWAAILEDVSLPCSRQPKLFYLWTQIEEVKSYFNEAEDEDYPADDGVQPNICLLFNFEPRSNKNELLAALPPRWVVDNLVFRVFDSNSSTKCEYLLTHLCTTAYITNSY